MMSNGRVPCTAKLLAGSGSLSIPVARRYYDASRCLESNWRWQLSGAFQIHSGWPATESAFVADTTTDGSVVLAREIHELAGLRLPAYHRLDLRVSRNFQLGRGVLQVYLDVFNFYDHTNLRSYRYWARVNDGVLSVTRTEGTDLLPRMPSIGARWEF